MNSIYLELVDDKSNKRRFHFMVIMVPLFSPEQMGGDLGTDWVAVMHCYGRILESQHIRAPKYFQTKWDAEQYMIDFACRKEAKGYRRIGLCEQRERAGYRGY